MPKHVRWGEMAEEASHATEHSLAGHVERLDRWLDDELEAGTAIRAVREATRTDDAIGSRRRVERDESARWANEMEVVRACVANGPPRAAAQKVGGDLGRALDRQALGTSGIASSSRAYEPHLGSDHYRHAWRVWMTALVDQERQLLTLMFASLVSPNDGGAERYARTIRAHLQHGKVSDAEAALPTIAVMLPVDYASAPAMVAIALGWAREDAGGLAGWPDVGAVRWEVSTVRARFRAALRRVELDASGESLTRMGDRLPTGTKPLLIPAPSMREQFEAPKPVAVCLGLGPMVNGSRRPCEVDVAVMRVESAARCPACGRPRR